MNRMLAALAGLLVLMIASASACHWYCCPTSGNPSGMDGVPSASDADQVVATGTTLTFTGTEPGKTYTWTVKDENGNAKKSGTGSVSYTFTGCNNGYSVIMNVAGTQDGCIICDCYTIYVTCPECPSISDWCIGHEPLTKPSMPPLAGFTYWWAYRTTDSLGNPTGDWVYLGSGLDPVTATSGKAYNTYASGYYKMWLKMEHGTSIKDCYMPFYVEPLPTGAFTVT